MRIKQLLCFVFASIVFFFGAVIMCVSTYAQDGYSYLTTRGDAFAQTLLESPPESLYYESTDTDVVYYQGEEVWSSPQVVTYNSGDGTFESGATNELTYQYDYTTNENTLLSGTYEEPTREGYTFSGWILSGENVGAECYVPSDVMREGITLTAAWTANEYTVTLSADDATKSGTTFVTATYDSTLPTINIPARAYSISYNPGDGTVDDVDGVLYAKNTLNSVEVQTVSYTFTGYYTQDDTQYYDTNGSGLTWDIAEDTTLYASWESASTTLPNATKTGYTFLGWYNEDGEKVGDAGDSYTPTEDVTLYAKWEASSYTVTLDSTGATNSGTTSLTATYDALMEDIEVPSGKTITVTFNYNGSGAANTTTQATATFCGYSANGGPKYFDENGGAVKAWDIASNATLYASWSGEVSLPSDPTRTGYTFAGWYTAASGGTKVTGTYTATGNTTLYAHWTANKYNTVFNPNGGSGGGTVSTAYGSSVTFPSNPTRSGYTFAGWYTAASGGTKVTSATQTNATVTYYAHWTEVTYSGTVKINFVCTDTVSNIHSTFIKTKTEYPWTYTDNDLLAYLVQAFPVDEWQLYSWNTTIKSYVRDTTGTNYFNSIEGANYSTSNIAGNGGSFTNDGGGTVQMTSCLRSTVYPISSDCARGDAYSSITVSATNVTKGFHIVVFDVLGNAYTKDISLSDIQNNSTITIYIDDLY